MTAVPLLQALLYLQQEELATMKALQRARATEVKAVRVGEAVKCRNLLSDFKSRYWSYSAPFVSWLALAVLCLLYRLVSN
jgi:hypothetical protein